MPAESKSKSSTRAGVLLVGHGTRSQRGQSEVLHLAELVRQRLPLPIEPAFLELAEPTIEQAVQRLVESGIDQLVVAPLLLFAAGHAKQDVPAKVSAALLKCGAPELPVRQASHFGCHPQIVELAHRRLTQAMVGERAGSGVDSGQGSFHQPITSDPNRLPTPLVPANETLVIVVGRGSHDPTATAEMHEFARLLAQRAAMPRVQVAFLAMAGPSVAEVLSAVDENVIRRVIVQPHLLFHGELIEALRRQVDKRSACHPHQEWIVSGGLADDLHSGGGAAELLPAATADVIQRALNG